MGWVLCDAHAVIPTNETVSFVIVQRERIRKVNTETENGTI